ncbi:MAG: GNAT family N-acetyltransferase, partial [Proteobacteria bacterium]|nr:GNAT family N-acetyltransferase [Pseudomonadota bacterium]
PEDTIIRQGGAILIVEDHSGVLGVCGLRYDSPGRYEVTKMAIREDMRSRGIGRSLLSRVISHARQLGSKQLFIISNTVLAPAISLYRQLGFVDVPLSTQQEYARGNIELELNLCSSCCLILAGNGSKSFFLTMPDKTSSNDNYINRTDFHDH